MSGAALLVAVILMKSLSQREPRAAGIAPPSVSSIPGAPTSSVPATAGQSIVAPGGNAATSPIAQGTNVAREFDLAINPYAAGLREPGKSKRAWDVRFLEQHRSAAVGDPIQFELTAGVMASGVVKIVQQDAQGITYMSGNLSVPEPGKFFFLRPPVGGRAGSAVGVIEFPASATAYRIEPTGEAGAPELWQRRMDEVLCLSMEPLDEETAGTMAEAPPLRPDLVPEYIPSYNSNIVSLQSLPGARGVVLLDYFGGYTASWNGVRYSAPNVSNADIREVWKRVAEDFMPLNINVTTDLKVFEAAPEGSRQRCVFAPDAPTPAGVAYFGSWNWGGDTVCWARYTTGKGAAEVGSHEIGHTVGLAHQTQDPPGTEFHDYYGGHGGPGNTGWAPIMGVGYYQPVTAWAKGEYLYAAELQDELAVMVTFNDVDFRTDDAGNQLGTSRHLEIYSNETVSAEGLIETTDDADAYQFTTSGGSILLTASPVGDWANLALMATLADSSGTVIASNNPQDVLIAGVSTNLGAGTYTFRVRGAGRNSPLTNGFSSYGSLGYYSITGSVAGARQPSRFTVDERSPNGTMVGTVTFPHLGAHSLVYTIASGNSNSAFALNNSGVLTVANSTALLYANLGYGTQRTVQFELFVNITDLTDSSQSETNRRVIVQVLDLPEPTMQMIHRWSFNNGLDSLGGANATLVGSASYSGGKLLIPGGPARANCATVNLNTTLATNTSLTIEGWFSMNALQDWSKLWMFGRPNGGSEPGLAYLDFTPRAGADGGVPSMSLNTGVRSFEANTRAGNDPAPLVTGTEYHVACVYDAVASVMSMYLNGVLVESVSIAEANITQLAATEAYFGAAVNYGDNNLNGSLNELRIYNGPQTALQLAINHATGPDNIVTNPGALLAVRLVVPNTNMVSIASQSVTVYADFANMTNVNVTTAGTAFSTGNPNIVAVGSGGLIRAYVPGTTSLTASFGGTNVSRTITVSAAPTVLAHRWSFNDDTDSIGDADASVVGTAAIMDGWLLLPGGMVRSNCAEVNIDETLDSTVSLTVESWFYITNQQDWAKLWMFGRKSEGGGDPWLSYIEFAPRAGAAGGVPSISFNPITGNEVNSRSGSNPALMVNGGSYYVATTYDAVSNLMSLYVNGVLVDSAPMGNGNITQLATDQGFFGAAVHYNDGCFNGAIDEMRVWKGVLTASQISYNAAAGPDVVVTNTVTVSGLELSVPVNPMTRGTIQPCSVTAHYTNGPSLNVTTNGATYASSNPAVVSVSASGVLSAMGAGTTTITASYGGTNDSEMVTVVGAPALAHRWSFTDLTDSIGGAHATLLGSAAVSGGQLRIPGGAARVSCARINGITNTLAAHQSLTIEGWFTMTNLQGWSKVWMFGTPNGGTQPGLSYVDFTPRRGDGSSAPSISFDSVNNSEANTYNGAGPAIMAVNTEYYVAAVYHTVSNMMYLYINGALADSASMNGENITQLAATEAWLGAAVYWPDSNLSGSINEVRIWDGPLSAAQIAGNHALGANSLPRPTLGVASAGSTFTISWPESFAGLKLESSLELGSGAAWAPVATPPVLAGGFYTVTLSVTNPTSFFRLKY
jgi:hypothetical protein